MTTDTNILTGVAICISAQLENVVCCGNTASSLVRNACLCWRAQEDTLLMREIPLQSRQSPWGLSCPLMVVVSSHQLLLGLWDWDPFNGCDRDFSLWGFRLFHLVGVSD